MSWLLLVIGTAFTVESFLRVPIIRSSKRLLALGKRSKRVVLSNSISDHWKERALQAYSRRLLLVSFLLVALMIVAFLPLSVIVAMDYLGGGHLYRLLTTPSGVLASLLVALAYSRVRVIHPHV